MNLNKIYLGGHPVLIDVDLTIGEGMFGLLGPNGEGKSTMMHILVENEPTPGLDPRECIRFRNLLVMHHMRDDN
jgi:ABC-type multidrug transport system ATPase subunit